MKASIGARRYSVFSLSKKLFGVLIFTATLFSFSYTTFAAIPPQYANYRLEYYDRWFTLFGNPTATVEREQVKNREASGIAYKGIKNCSSVIQVLQPTQPIPTTPTITNPAGISGCTTPTGGGLVGIKDIDLLVSLDKRMRNQSDFQYENGNNTTVVTGYSSISSLDFYKEPKNRAEYTYDMIGDDSGSGPRGFAAFLIKTTYTTTLGRERTIFSVVPNKEDNGETSVVEKESFIIDYDSNRNEIEQQSVIKNIVFGEGELAAKPGTTATSTFWYCGGKQNDIPGTGISTSGIVGDGTDPLDTDIRPEYKNRIARFRNIRDEVTNATNTFCGGTAYYQIGSDLTYQIPNSIDEAVQQQVDNADLITGQTRRGGTSNLPSCKTGTFSFNLLGCIAQGLYGLIFYPISFVAGLLGQIFDWFLAYSLSDESYRHTFVETAWRLVRDISNIFFIIIMVYTGLSAVFSTSSTSYKRVIPALIVNALLINFSLFAARIVIDISNITARLFYNQITVTVDGSKSTATVKPISEAIVSAFNPQRVFDNVLAKEVITTEDTVAAANGTVTFNGSQDFGQKRDDWTVNDTDYAQYFILVTIMASLIMWGVAMMFWKTAFLFVGRVIQLYISMIFSPFAFLSRDNIPLVSKISALKFDTWWGDLSKSAIMAPIFIFFLYIINAFLGIEFFDKVGMSQSIAQGSATLSFFDSVLKILIPMLLIYGLIGKAVDIAKMFSTSIGNSVQNAIGGFANKAAGLAGGVALGVATGGAALAARGVVGRMALSAETKASLEASRAAGGLSGRLASLRLGADKTLQSSSFDARNTGIFKNIQGAFGKEGIKFNDPLTGRLGMGTDDTKGGVKGADKRAKDKLKKQIESISAGDIKDDKVKELWEKKTATLIEKEKKRLLADENALIEAHKKQGKTDAEIASMKASGTIADEIAKKNITEQYGDVTNKNQLTRALRQEFAQTIAEGKTFSQQLSPINIIGGVAGAAGLVSVAGGGMIPVVGGIGLDASRAESERKKNAKKYFDDAVKNKKKLPKQERLEEEKKRIETELEEMDNYVESIQDTLKKHFETIIREADAGNEDFKKFKGRTVDSFKSKPEDIREALKMQKESLEAEFESKEMDIEDINEQYKEAKKSGDLNRKNMLDAQRKAAIIEKARIKRKMDNIDNNNRSRKEGDLAKKEAELDKIKEKEDNKDKPKDDKK